MTSVILANHSMGLVNFRKELIEQLAESNDKVTLSVPQDKKLECFEEKHNIEILDTNVDRRGLNPIRDMRLFYNYCKILKRVKPDIVITYTIKPNIYGGLACRIKRVPYYVNITGLGSAFQKDGFVKKIVVLMYKIALKKAKIVFFENSDNAETLINLGCCNQKQSCILNGAGVNLEKYSYSEMPTFETTKFCFVGRIMKEKGIDELLYAINKMKEKRINATFDFFGDFEENYKNKIQTMIENGYINYYGMVDDMQDRYSNYHCLVLPSYHEGMSNAVLEACSTGRAVIVSDIFGCKEAVNEEKNGILCKVKDADSLYNALTKFVSLSDEDKRKMGIESRKYMEEKFDKMQTINKTLQMIARGTSNE